MGMVACFAGADPATIARFREDPSQIEEFLYPDEGEGEPEHYIDLDKAWHCIHFMLTGNAGEASGPLGSAILGGDELGEDVGYGPARIILPEQVHSIAGALSQVDEESFKSKFNPVAMQAADVYLSDMCADEGNDALEYLVENYLSLVRFYQDASNRGDGDILWVS